VVARLLGPDMGSRYAYTSTGAPAAGASAIVYANSGGTILADIRVYDGSGTPGGTIVGSAVTVDAHGLLPLFWFPDGVDRVWVSAAGGPVTPVDADYNARIDQALPLVGGTLTGSLALTSSFAGGEDEGQPGQFDSTSRINLESYQRADFHSYGEVVRIYSRRADSKQMVAWYGPTSYDPVTRAPIGSDKPWFWMGAHYESNNHDGVHGHWSCEVPDTTGALQTRLEFAIWNPGTGQFGMDKTTIKTNQADFVVRCSNGQELRLSAVAGVEKNITFSNDSDGADAFRRWRIRVTSEAESGSNAGSNFALARYGDDGVLIDSPIIVSRSTGNVTLTPGVLVRRQTSSVSALSLNTTSLGGGQGVIAFGNSATPPNANPTGGIVLYVASGRLKIRQPDGTDQFVALTAV
ncbi:hypothetical protein ABGB07_46105, partial [Micromonosporaceae bacterium B7E4]